MPNDRAFYGVHACRALFECRPDAIERALMTESVAPIFGDLMKDLARRRRPYRVVGQDEVEKVAGTRHHEGICVIAAPPPSPAPDQVIEGLGEAARFVFLDGVSNPHNVGAILRSAAHFGATAIAGLPGEIPVVAGAVARIAAGGGEHVPVLRWPDPSRVLERLRGHGFVSIATVVRDAPSLYATPLPPRCVFLVGAEREGLSDAAREAADIGVTIPGSGAVDSLNVAAAVTVLLAEHARQHPLP